MLSVSNGLHKNTHTVKTVVSCFFYLSFCFFSIFPYIQIVPLPTDTQPYALVLSVVIFLLMEKKIAKTEIFLLYVCVVSLFLFLIDGMNFNALRSFLNYLSLFFISFVSFRVIRSNLVNFEFFIKTSTLVWFSVSAIQNFFSRDFLTFLVASARTTDNRGVTGLAPEPTFLGIVFVFFILIYTHSNFKNKKIYIALSVVAIIFFAKSSMALLFLFLMVFFWFITSMNSGALLIIGVSILLMPYLIGLMEGSRIGYLLVKVQQDPMQLLLVDASINDRFFHVFLSIKGFLDNYLLPNGYSAWLEFSSSQMKLYSNYIIVEWFTDTGRIMSGFGSAFFELGFFAFFIPLYIVVNYSIIYREKINLVFFYSLFLISIMFSAITVGFPLFCFYLGYVQYLAWKRAHE